MGTWKWNLSNPDYKSLYKKPQQSIVNNQLRLDLKKCLLAINWLSHILQMPTRNNPIGLKCKICILEYKKLFLKKRCISKLMVQLASTGATFKPNLFYKNETILLLSFFYHILFCNFCVILKTFLCERFFDVGQPQKFMLQSFSKLKQLYIK